MTKLCLLLLWLCPLFTYAQSSEPEPYIINADTSGFQLLDDGVWQMIEDTSAGKWSIEQVSNLPISNTFRKEVLADKSTDRAVNTYWIRFKLKNNLPHEVNLLLQQKSAFADYYVAANDGKWLHTTTGYKAPWSNRDGYKLINAVPVTIQPGEEVSVYERMIFDYRTSRPKPLEAGFGFTQKMVQDNYVDNDSFLFKTILGSFFIGLLFFAAVFNFFFFLVVQERVYLYYALCLLFGAINEYYSIFFHVFFRSHPAVLYTNLVFFLVLVNFFAIQMERHFLQTFTHYPRWDKVLQLSVFIQLLAALAIYFAGPHLTNNTDTVLWKAWDWIQGFVLVCILVTFLLFVGKKDKSARHFVMGCLPVAIIWVVNYIVTNGTNNAIATEWNQYYDKLELLCISALVIVLSWILFQRYNKLRKENAEQALLNERLAKEKEIERRQLIAQQKVVLEKEVEERTAELKQSLQDLKAAQRQLIQTEKMASLGEVTSGIAHEIQNPLNFVNNFSEVSAELIEELKSEQSKEKNERNEALENDLLDDISSNLEKINQHGKRAEVIVKAMLQHSNSGNSKKEPVDINTLTDKYLSVSYTSFINKEKTLPVKLVTDFDESIGNIHVVQQDIGRVLLNLYSNALYAVNERRKAEGEGFKATVLVQTKKTGANIEIKVTDNGLGIPQNVVDKIFQPFFTTKPTGQGTGLGLFLAYDIITKEHNGTIRVESKEGEGSVFIIQLPI